MQTFEQVMITGESKRFPCGRYFFLLYAPSGVDLEFLGKNQQLIGGARGVKGGFSTDFESYEERPLAVKITSLGDQTVKGQYSDIASIGYVRSQGDIDNITNIVNPVEVYGDLAREYSNANNFVGGIVSPAVSSNYNLAQVFNPVGSGKIVAVTSAIFVLPSITTATVKLSLSTVALDTLVSKFANTVYGGDDSGAEFNRTETTDYTVLGSEIVSHYAGGDSYFEMLKTPFFLNEGNGLSFVNATVGLGHSIHISITEWDI